MVKSANLGFPRIGKFRELKKATESFWKGEIDQAELEKKAREIRRENWLLQQAAGIDHIPSGDFSFYDLVLDTTAMLGALPERFKFSGGKVDLTTYFSLARGTDTLPPMAMTKWFDTNYHYIVPEFEKGMVFKLASTKIVDQYQEARALGIETRPVLIGPVTYLLSGQSKSRGLDPLDLLDNILPVYKEILGQLAQAGAQWIQIDEPVLATELNNEEIAAIVKTYTELNVPALGMKLCLAAYFDSVEDKLEALVKLPINALHLDLVRAPQQLDKVLALAGDQLILSLGVVNGRNVWKCDLSQALAPVEKAIAQLGAERVMVAPSCSLLHSPVDLAAEEKLEAEIKERMAFATQKLHEVVLLQKAGSKGKTAVADALQENQAVFDRARASTRVNNPKVRQRLANLTEADFNRRNSYPGRRKAQQASLKLPLLPTTTIGSYPQVTEIRKARADYKKGQINAVQYEAAMKRQIERVVRFQEQADLDVLVHGEPERNDMVEYFGELLEGVAFTQNGWVQSYGTRCVKPPVIWGDISRPNPMTLDWILFAQSLTERYMKGMLTGPITILQWSFVREDQPRSDTAYQIALAIRDEVSDLEAAGIKIIQIDEPAFREGVPLRRSQWPDYFDWAVKAFRLTASCVKDDTQIHTHMCYSDFNEIIAPIAALDADVISMEASRSDIRLLNAFVDYKYPNEIGPGVYDIHSPRIPSVEEMKIRALKMAEVIDKEQLWINPDCGLKTRGWPEIEAALKNMVVAARQVRQELRA